MSWLSKALGIKGKEDIGSTENNDLGRGNKCWRSQNDKNGAAEELKEDQCSCSLDNQQDNGVMSIEILMTWITQRVLMGAKHLDSGPCYIIVINNHFIILLWYICFIALHTVHTEIVHNI